VATYLDLPARVPAAVRTAAGWDGARRANEADRCCDVIAYSADALWADPAPRRGRGPAAISREEVREAIVTGLAILACRPRGAGFGGLHWHSEARRCADCPGPGDWTLPASAGQNGRGVAFTPRSMAEDLAVGALRVITQPTSPAADIEALRTADPFCGSGALLVAAGRYLGDALEAAWAYRRDGAGSASACDRADETEIGNLCTLYGTPDPAMAARALVVSHGLYGTDLDPLSVELAGVALQLLAPAASTDHLIDVDEGDYAWYVATAEAPGPVTQYARLVRPAGPPTSRLPGLRAGDALTGRPWPPGMQPGQLPGLHWPAVFPGVCGERGGGFDAVLTNPPFLGGNQIVHTCGHDYRDHLVRAIAGGKRTTVDLAVYCWIRAHQLASADGVVAVIGPDSLLRGDGNKRLGLAEVGQRGWQRYRHLDNLTWPARSAAVRVSMTWTSRWGGADIPDDVRNTAQEPPPAHLWAGTPVKISGKQSGLTSYTPLGDQAAGYWWEPGLRKTARGRAAAQARRTDEPR
jgi:hypothetical protein